MTATWTTLATRPAGQFAHWRELICAAFLALTPESDLREGFAGTVTQWPLGRLNLARIDSQRQTVRRTGDDITRTPIRGYYANLQVRGTGLVAQQDRVAVLRPGDLAVVDTAEPFAMEFAGDFRQLSFFVPERLLDAQLPGPVRTATRISTSSGVGAAVRLALESVSGTPPRAADRLAIHAAGMLAVALDPTILAPVRAPRTHTAAVADIEAHLTDDDLSPAATARRLGVSVRFVHGLFAGHPESYTATVRRFRLQKAARDLRDPALSRLRVIDIATEAGFANVASFHRAFRRAFGRTPNELRVSRTHL
jgi:AraC family transcriptional activator of tynA and feaB